MKYLNWNETTITDFSEKNIGEMYEKGYVFTRIGKGVMHQTRSLRIDLTKFNLSSENRRILKKVPSIKLELKELPLVNYDYSIGKIAKDFYKKKFGPGIMSAQKIKMMLTDKENSNFNKLLEFSTNVSLPEGFAICFSNQSILHYSYPFYNLDKSSKDMGLAMMISAIQYAKEAGLKYVYLGSLQRPTDTYKLQFSGMEWFDRKNWNNDLEKAKEILSQIDN